MNVLQILVSSQTQTADEGLLLASTEQNLSLEQQFGDVFAHYVEQIDQNKIPNELPVSLFFESQLVELLALLNQVNFGDMSKEETEVSSLFMMDDYVAEAELNQVDESLLAYLQQFEEVLEQGEFSSVDLLTFFTQIPELPLELHMVLSNNSFSQEGSAGQVVNTDSEEHWLRWSQLLNFLNQTLKNEQLASETKQVQVKQATLALIHKWSQNSEWLASLQGNIRKETGLIRISAFGEDSKQERPVFNSQIPLSLLNQVVKEQGLSNLAQTNLNIGAKSEENQSVVNNQLTNSVAELKEIALDIKERTLPVANVAKGNETNSASAARFAHLVEDMKGILRNQVSLLKNGDTSQLRVRLTPEHLGHLDIRITSMNGKIIAQIMTSSKMAKDLLDVQLHQLRTALTQQGIQVERVEVTQNTNSSTNLLQHEHKDSQHFQQQKGQKGLKGNQAQQNEYVDIYDGEDVASTSNPYEYTSQINYAV